MNKRVSAFISLIFYVFLFYCFFSGEKLRAYEADKVDLLDNGVKVTAVVTGNSGPLSSCDSALLNGFTTNVSYTYEDEVMASRINNTLKSHKEVKKEITKDNKLEILVDPEEPDRVSTAGVINAYQKHKGFAKVVNIVLICFCGLGALGCLLGILVLGDD